MNKLILSRKGFDSAAGRVPSPILEDGTLLSLPIPECDGSYTYGELAPQGIDLGMLVSDLTSNKQPKNRITHAHCAHLDPDLDPTSAPRSAGWRPAFGQANAAAAHLDNQGVGPGDIFLFFGWFRRVERIAGAYRYVPKAPNLHVFFGWLRIGEIIDPQKTKDIPQGLERHPHIVKSVRDKNRVYLAASPADGGIFPRFSPDLQLTVPGSSRSLWQLPAWFHPNGREPLSYHRNSKRWRQERDLTYLQTASRGQEFVLDLPQYPEAIAWVEKILSNAAPHKIDFPRIVANPSPPLYPAIVRFLGKRF